MESEFSPDKALQSPPVPIKTYQWEDLKRAREAGGYPWTHLLKPPLEGEVTAADIIRETTPTRNMSREVSRSRTRSPVDKGLQKILNLDSSPGSSRRHGEEGEDEGVQIPNFSKEISLESEDDPINHTVKSSAINQMDSAQLVMPVEIPKNVSPKSILKRRTPEPQFVPISETRDKTRCCHPLVNKIKHLADKTLQKLEKGDSEKSPLSKRKKNDHPQEIRQLKSSPSAVRRQKFSAIKLGDSDEMSKTLSVDSTPPPTKKKEHIYEDIDESNQHESEKCLQFSADIADIQMDNSNNNNTGINFKESENLMDKKSNASQDPSLCTDENIDLRPEEYLMEKLHTVENIDREALVLDLDNEEPNIDEIFQNQLDEVEDKDSPNITITEIIDEDTEEFIGENPCHDNANESSRNAPDANDWSKVNSDHEYEIIEKPPPHIVYTAPSMEEKLPLENKEDELSSTTSLERKFLQHTSDDEDHIDDDDGLSDLKDEVSDAEALQKDIEDRYFINTPSTVSRTECEISTSQVDSSALENLPLKRESRSKQTDSGDNKIQSRFRESTGILKSQAGKLKTKLQNIKNKQFSMPDKSRFKFPDRPKFTMPERPKLSFLERPKFSLPERRKFSLPDRPKFRKINISEKLSLGDRKKFTFPERPKFNVPDLPKFKLPDRPKINFPSLSRKKEYKIDHDSAETNIDLRNVAAVEFETKTYPRLFKRKKKPEPLASSSPTLNREDTPPPTFTFTKVTKLHKSKPIYRPDSPAEPREYGNIDITPNFEEEEVTCQQHDFDKIDEDYIIGDETDAKINDSQNTVSTPDISSSKQEYTHVINEINNDEFFVRPRGISRENIQVREYLSDEIRQAFKIPKNALALMGSNSMDNQEPLYANDAEEDPELLLDENEQIRYSNDDLNERDDGYYTFPPVRPSRAKRKKNEVEPVQYIDESIHASMQFSDVDLGPSLDHIEDQRGLEDTEVNDTKIKEEYPEEIIQSHLNYSTEDTPYPEDMPIQSQTLPAPPKRKRKFGKKSFYHSSLNEFREDSDTKMYSKPHQQTEDIVVYRTEHEYIVPESETVTSQRSPVPPRRSRNRSRSSHGTSLCDDDRTSQGADSLTLDTHLPATDDIGIDRYIRHDSPGYATVDKGGYTPNKTGQWFKTKTPPARRRKSHSSERKYYTVGSNKESVPNRPPRKKSSTSLMTLDSMTKRSLSGDITQYVEIDDEKFEEVHKDLKSGEIVSKMKDRPLPPPPRPPRGSKRNKKFSNEKQQHLVTTDCLDSNCLEEYCKDSEVVEIEVSTQTDPLPDDVDFELGLDENLDFSMSSSLRDMVEGDLMNKSLTKLADSPRHSRPVSRSEKSIKLSDPKITELSKANIGRTSPTVILVERRVSSPTRINEREEIVTEASLTVQHIDVDESMIPEVPPLPRSRITPTTVHTTRDNMVTSSENKALERVADSGKDIQLDNLVTQRLQVKDLDVGRLNVSELQASKILVSEMEGMTLQVTELDSKSGHISVSGIEFSQSIIDEIVKKFAELSTPVSIPEPSPEPPRPISREEETQTDELIRPNDTFETPIMSTARAEEQSPLSPVPPPPPPRPEINESVPPQRPPPPDLTPLLYSYLQDLSMPPASFYHLRTPRDRPFTDFHESQQSPPPPTKRQKRKPAPHSDSSSDESRPRPSPRRMQPPLKNHEPTITEAGAQFLRVCHNSISRTLRSLFNSFISYISGTEDKKDVQMALVIFLVLIAGLIMFGLSDSRTIHHHHWEFFNPPDGKQ